MRTTGSTAAVNELTPTVEERFYHYTPQPFVFDRERIYPTDCDLFKPRGLWLSVEREGDDDYRGWKDWCECESFNVDGLAHRVEVRLAPDAHIKRIADESELLRFDREFRSESRLRAERINWHRVMCQFDGVIIAPMIWSQRLALLWYYGWDCSSACIWNMRAIEAVCESATTAGAVDPVGELAERDPSTRVDKS